VLVVFTANQCRSPLGGAALRREAARRQLPIDVITAGFRATGSPATDPTLAVARELGFDLDAHVSRLIDRALLSGADLVVGMERLHVREAVVLEPAVWRRTMTLRDLVRRAERVAPRRNDEPLRPWVEELSAGRDRMSVMGADADDDVRDPTTDLSVDHRSTAEMIDDLVVQFVSRAWPA
jgi:protein-tyrosine-phosphatase